MEASKEIPVKNLPKNLQPYASIDLIRSNSISNEEKANLVKMYNKNNKDWTAPK